VVHEHILAAGSLDKAIAFGGVEPLHGAFFLHYSTPELGWISNGS
jgi:hypothetical protein